MTTTAPAETLAVDHPGDGEPGNARWIALGVIALAQLMVVLDATIVNIALPSAQRDLGISNDSRQWVITAYTLAFGGLLLLGGRVSDYWGRKRSFLIGLVGFAAASALGGAAIDAPMLYGARAIQGAFGALLAPAALSLITTTFTKADERAKAFAVYGAIAGGGAAVGLLLGGILTSYINWRFCLFVNVLIAAIAFVAGTRVVKESKTEGDRHYDIPGAVLVTAGLVALVYGFTEAAKAGVGWQAPITLGLIVGGLVLLALFVVAEMRSSHPLLPLRVILDRDRGGSFLTSLVLGGGLFAMFLFLTYYFQVVLGYSPIRSGLAFLPFSAGIVITAGAVAQLLPRTGPKPLMVLGTAMATGGLIWLTGIGLHTSYLTSVLPPEILMSVGLALTFVPLSNTSLVGVADEDAGVASALLNATQQIGGSLGTALLNTVAAGAITSYLADHSGSVRSTATQIAAQVHSYHVAFVWGAGLIFVGFLSAALIVRAGKDDIPTDAPAAMG